MKVLALGGSPRKGLNTDYLIDQALVEIRAAGIETEKIILNDYKIAPCQAHPNCQKVEECLVQDDFNWIMKKYCEADGFIIASPVYFSTINAQVKTFMDRTDFIFGHRIEMKAKCAGLITVAGHEGAAEAMKELKKFVTFAKYPIFTLESNNGGRETYVKVLPEDIEKAREIGRQMVSVLNNITK